jgi:hypothetical protein
MYIRVYNYNSNIYYLLFIIYLFKQNEMINNK